MKTALINAFAQKGGFFARIIASAIVGAITAGLARFGLEMSAADSAELGGFIALIVSGAIGEQIAAMQSKSIATMQTAVSRVDPNVQVDGHAGEITVAAVDKMAKFVGDITVPKI